MSITTSYGEVGPYRLIAEIGRGGMGELHLALRHGPGDFDKPVVIKRIHAHFANNPDAHAMLMDEARVAGRLNHPNVVQTIEVAEHDGSPYIVMEYLEGRDFVTLMNRVRATGQRLDLVAALHIVREALEGLRYVHELTDFDGTPLRLVHRDFSAENIFITYDGCIKVLDFGIAKGSISTLETDAGVLKGKLSCMAPEQILGDPVDERTDVYAAGAVLWHVAAGRRLWKDAPAGQAVYRITTGDVPNPSSVRAEVDPRLEKICCRALSTVPEERYPDVRSLIADVESLIDSLGPRPSPRSIGQLAASLFATERTDTQEVLAVRAREVSGRLISELPPPTAITVPPSRSDLETTLTEPGVNSSKIDSFLLGQWTARPFRKRLRVLVLAAAACLLVGIPFAWPSAHDGIPADPQTLSMAMPSGIQPPETSEVVERAEPDLGSLILSAEPRNARVFVDDRALDQLPAELRFSIGSRHRVRVEAEGFVAQEVDFGSQQSERLQVRLKPAVVARPRPPAWVSPRPIDSAAKTETDPALDLARRRATARERIQTLDTSNPWDG